MLQIGILMAITLHSLTTAISMIIVIHRQYFNLFEPWERFHRIKREQNFVGKHNLAIDTTFHGFIFIVMRSE